jgi:DNA helicase-2/ATP-dependent DNA helicase PcrA
MIQFRKHFPKATIITLTQNYRSTQEILDKSHTLVAYNDPDRLEVQEHIDKRLVANKKGKLYPIELLYEERVEDEADSVVKTIVELVKKEKYTYKDIAILVRANDHATTFIKALQRNAIPYQFLGPGRLFRQEEIKDLIAYLKVLYNFEDSASVYRVLTSPTFAIDSRMIASILNFARRKNYSLFEALESIASQADEQQTELFVKDTEKEKIKNFVAMIHKHLKRVPTDSAGQILYYYIEDTGLLKKFLAATSETDVKQYQNIAKLFDKLKSFEAEHEDARVFPVVDWIDLSMQMGESPLANDSDWAENNAVNILTIHSSKGLEFPVVFLVNLVSQRFPTRERREQIPIPVDLIKEILPEGDYHLQEERRLFYVGMTRAKERLYFTAAKYYGEGKRDRKISPFVIEALGETNVGHILRKQVAEKAVIQPSLLDWVNTMNGSYQQYTDTPDETKVSFLPPITYVSYSQLQTFDMCPLHYKLQYLLKIPGQQTAPLSFGTSLHAALRDFYTAWIQNEKIPLSSVDDMLKKVWINEGYSSKAHEIQAREQALYLLHQYLDKYLIHDGSQKPVAIEVPFSFFVADQNIKPNGVKIGGRIDRVDQRADGSIEIIDYKTGKNVPSEKDLVTNLQLTLYALAATSVKDAIFNKQSNQITLSLHYLEEDKILTTTRTKEQLEEAKTHILRKILEIEQSDFQCSGNILCQNCEYKMLCSKEV